MKKKKAKLLCFSKTNFFRKNDLFHYLYGIKPSETEDINRIKVVLVEKKRNKYNHELLNGLFYHPYTKIDHVEPTEPC